jgi:hypothetical protein
VSEHTKAATVLRGMVVHRTVPLGRVACCCGLPNRRPPSPHFTLHETYPTISTHKRLPFIRSKHRVFILENVVHMRLAASLILRRAIALASVGRFQHTKSSNVRDECLHYPPCRPRRSRAVGRHRYDRLPNPISRGVTIPPLRALSQCKEIRIHDRGGLRRQK